MKLPSILTASTTLAACAGCGFAGWDLPVKVDTDQPVQIEAMEWYNTTFGQDVFVLDPDGVPVRFAEPGDPDYARRSGYTELSWNMDGDVTKARITIAHRMQSNPVVHRYVMAHELAHLLGYDYHSTVKSGEYPLMAPSVPDARTISLDVLLGNDTEFVQWLDDSYGLRVVDNGVRDAAD